MLNLFQHLLIDEILGKLSEQVRAAGLLNLIQYRNDAKIHALHFKKTTLSLKLAPNAQEYTISTIPFGLGLSARIV